jgi:hypothetical protein
MITAVPATIVTIMVAMVSTVGRDQRMVTAEQAVPGKRPERAGSTYLADTMTAAPR